MQYVEFSDVDKIKIFDQLSGLFYDTNFGRTPKADIELLMFHAYLEKMVEEHKRSDGTIDYSACSDYKISRDLGITQQRVRDLKVKSQLVYPIDFDWKKALAAQIKHARYDQTTQKITIGIPDPNLYLEIQNFIEEHGGHIEKQLNSKNLQLRIEYFIDLVVSLEEDEASRQKIVAELRQQFKSSRGDDAQFDEKNIGKSLLEAGANIATILEAIGPYLTGIGVALMGLLAH